MNGYIDENKVIFDIINFRVIWIWKIVYNRDYIKNKVWKSC